MALSPFSSILLRFPMLKALSPYRFILCAEILEALWIRSFKNRTEKLKINPQNITEVEFQRVKAVRVWFLISKEGAVMLNYQENKKKIS